MTGLSTGSTLSAAASAPEAVMPVTSEISVIVPLAASALYEGQSISDIAGFAALTATANFTSTGGPVTTVSVAPLGDAADVSAPLSEGSRAGFTATVTDATGASRTFGTGLVTVEYKLRVLALPDDTLELDLNPLLPPDALLEITVTEPSVYAGLYQVSLPDLDSGPGALVPPAISGDIGEDNLLSADQGLWVSAADGAGPVLSLQWLRNGAEIAGATATDYVQTAQDAAATISLRVTATDAFGSRDVLSNVLGNSFSFAVAETDRFVEDAGTRLTNPRTRTNVALGTDQDKDVYLLVGTTSGAPADLLGHTDVSIAGTPATRLATTGDGDTIDRVHMELWHLRTAASVGDLVFTPRGRYRQLTVQVISAPAVAGTPALTVTPYGSDTATDLSVPLAGGDVFLGAITREADAGDGTVFAGAQITGAPLEDTFAGRYSAYCRHDATAAETPRSITATHSGTASTVAGLGIVLRAMT